MNTSADQPGSNLDRLLADRTARSFPDGMREPWQVALDDAATVRNHADWGHYLDVPSYGPDCQACVDELPRDHCPPGSCPECTQNPNGTWP